MKCQKEYIGSRHGSLEYLLIVDLIIQYQDSANLYCLMGQGVVSSSVGVECGDVRWRQIGSTTQAD